MYPRDYEHPSPVISGRSVPGSIRTSSTASQALIPPMTRQNASESNFEARQLRVPLVYQPQVSKKLPAPVVATGGCYDPEGKAFFGQPDKRHNRDNRRFPLSTTHSIDNAVSYSQEDVTAGLLVDSLGLDDAGKEFMLALLLAASSAPVGRGRAAKLIIPRLRGYIVRSDIIPLRMAGTLNVIRVTSLADLQQWFAGETLTEVDFPHLLDVFRAAAGGIVIDVGESAYDMAADLDAFETEARLRLSFPWLLEQRRPRQTLVFVGNYLRYPGHGGTGSNHYSFAKAMDINLVVLDAPGCWLEDPKHSDLRGTFLPCDLTRDDGLCDRIIDALTHYKGKINGIVTFHESLQFGVAKAAELLSLPTPPPAALAIAADKYKTGVSAGHSAYLATSVGEALEIVKEHNLRYPLILKPCRGWGSEGLYRADNALEFAEAAEAIDKHAVLHGPRFVVEEYCDGPEVDVNMVLSNGELLFVQVCDDLPKRGDGVLAGNVLSFIEFGMIYPSKLPSPELNLLVRDLHQNLLRLGLHSGVFHLEARVKDSEMAYVPQDGLLDLDYHRNPTKAATPSTWLIEINARPPGITGSDPAEGTYGVDYIGLGLLFALDDRQRISALSHPFIQGPQYWSQALFIPVERGGVFDSDNICDELMQRRPDLAQHVARSVCCWKRGEVVPPSGHAAWIAHFVVFSCVGRRHLLGVAETIRQEVRYSII